MQMTQFPVSPHIVTPLVLLHSAFPPRPCDNVANLCQHREAKALQM